MVNFCAVFGCSNRASRDKGKSFYRLPAAISRKNATKQALSKQRREKWIEVIRREDIFPPNYEYIRICSDHFISGKPAALIDTENPDWCPNQKIGDNICQTNPSSMQRYLKSRERRRKQQIASALLELSQTTHHRAKKLDKHTQKALQAQYKELQKEYLKGEEFSALQRTLSQGTSVVQTFFGWDQSSKQQEKHSCLIQNESLK